MLLAPGENRTPDDWSRDGRFLLYTQLNSRGKFELWVLPMTVGSPGARKPAPFLQTEFTEAQGQFSPDTHWIAYASNESGRAEIYVQPFPASSGGVGKTKISEGGGTYPRWHRDGRELFYISGDQKLMAVEVTSGPAFKAGIPKPLFQTRLRPGAGGYFNWDVSADGKRFLINTPAAASAEAPVTVVTNWQAALKK
jgi:Tol biopolymer transport system component